MGCAWKFSGTRNVRGLAINNETSCEELYAKVRNICQVDNIEIGFLTPAAVQTSQFPARITSNEDVEWYFNINKQGCHTPLCVTHLSQDKCDRDGEENNGLVCDMENEENNEEENNGEKDEMQAEGNNACGGDGQNANHLSDKLNVIRESLSGDQIDITTMLKFDGVSQDSRDQGKRLGDDFTSEDLFCPFGSTARVLPADIDLKVDQVFDNKKELQDAVHLLALNNNFQFKTKKSNKSMYTIACLDDNCKWRLHATKSSECDRFQIRKYFAGHTCPLDQSIANHRQATSRIIGMHILPKFDDSNAKYKPADVRSDVKRSLGVELSYQKARRCRKFALRHLQGSSGDSH